MLTNFENFSQKFFEKANKCFEMLEQCLSNVWAMFEHV